MDMPNVNFGADGFFGAMPQKNSGGVAVDGFAAVPENAMKLDGFAAILSEKANENPVDFEALMAQAGPDALNSEAAFSVNQLVGEDGQSLLTKIESLEEIDALLKRVGALLGLNIDMEKSLNKVDADNVPDEMVSQLADFLAGLKELSGLLQKAGESNIPVDVAGEELSGDELMEVSSTLKNEIMKFELCCTKLNISGRMATATAAQNNEFSLAGMQVAVNPKDLAGTQKLPQSIAALFKKEESQLEGMIGAIRKLAAATAQAEAPVSADVKAIPADAKAIPADAKAIPADAKAIPADAKAIPADAKSSVVDAKSTVVDAKSTVVDAKSTVVDAKATVVDAKATVVDAKATVVDAKATVVDAKATVVDAKSSVVDAKASVVDAKATVVDAKSSVVDAKATVVDAKATVVDAKSTVVDAKSSVVDAKASVVDAKATVVDAKATVVDAKSSVVDAKSSVVDAKSSVVDAKTVNPVDQVVKSAQIGETTTEEVSAAAETVVAKSETIEKDKSTTIGSEKTVVVENGKSGSGSSSEFSGEQDSKSSEKHAPVHTADKAHRSAKQNVDMPAPLATVTTVNQETGELEIVAKELIIDAGIETISVESSTVANGSNTLNERSVTEQATMVVLVPEERSEPVDLSAPVQKAEKTHTPRTFEQNVADQVSNKLVESAKNGVREVTVVLKPELLGEVKITIKVHGEVVSAKLQVESQQVKNIIESNLQNLRDSLAEQKLTAGSLDVNVGSGESRHADEQPNRRRKSNFAGFGDEADADGFIPDKFGKETGRRYGTNTLEYFA